MRCMMAVIGERSLMVRSVRRALGVDDKPPTLARRWPVVGGLRREKHRGDWRRAATRGGVGDHELTMMFERWPKELVVGERATWRTG